MWQRRTEGLETELHINDQLVQTNAHRIFFLINNAENISTPHRGEKLDP